MARRLASADARRGATLLLGAVVVVFAAYIAYVPFEAWWFLRFLLPAWPAMAIGTSSLLLALAGGAAAWRRRVAVIALCALGVYGII